MNTATAGTCLGCDGTVAAIGNDVWRCPDCGRELALVAMEFHNSFEHWKWHCGHCQKAWVKVKSDGRARSVAAGA